MTTTASTAPHQPSRACYLRGCPQAACRDKHLRYCKTYQYDTAHNGPRTTPATPYIPKIQDLVTDGWTHAAIAEATSVGITTIRDLAAGDNRHIHIDTARLLDHNLPTGAPQNWWVDVTGTMRRIQALTVIGWPQERIAAEIGLGYSTIRRIANGGRRHTPRRTADAITTLYADWSHRPGPSRAAAGRARARGWLDPDYWEDVDRIDDPDYDPHATAEETRAQYIADEARWLIGGGLSRDQAAARLGVSRFYIDRALRDHPEDGADAQAVAA